MRVCVLLGETHEGERVRLGPVVVAACLPVPIVVAVLIPFALTGTDVALWPGAAAGSRRGWVGKFG